MWRKVYRDILREWENERRAKATSAADAVRAFLHVPAFLRKSPTATAKRDALLDHYADTRNTLERAEKDLLLASPLELVVSDDGSYRVALQVAKA